LHKIRKVTINMALLIKLMVAYISDVAPSDAIIMSYATKNAKS